MTLDHSAVNELLEAFRAGDGVDLIRESVRIVLQDLIEIEAAEVIGAHRYERSEDRTTERNGYRDRSLSTQAGDIELRIPKLRKGSFFPEILEPRHRLSILGNRRVLRLRRALDARTRSMAAAVYWMRSASANG